MILNITIINNFITFIIIIIIITIMIIIDIFVRERRWEWWKICFKCPTIEHQTPITTLKAIIIFFFFALILANFKPGFISL